LLLTDLPASISTPILLPQDSIAALLLAPVVIPPPPSGGGARHQSIQQDCKGPPGCHQPEARCFQELESC